MKINNSGKREKSETLSVESSITIFVVWLILTISYSVFSLISGMPDEHKIFKVIFIDIPRFSMCYFPIALCVFLYLEHGINYIKLILYLLVIHLIILIVNILMTLILTSLTLENSFKYYVLTLYGLR